MLILIIIVIVGRLFNLQVIKHDHYKAAALSDQLKEYTITADRGIIEAHEAGGVVPLVLNQKLYTLFVDPTLVKDPAAASQKVAAVTRADADQYEKLMRAKNTRYVILGKKLSQAQSDAIVKLKLPGVGTQAQNYRIYPQGSLASQLLGFVNDDGKGTYGIEQALNKQLAGSPGELKAITDASGVPLAASKDNIQIDPKKWR